MALDPSIALNVKPIEVANPLAQYGQVAQLQAAQNQNALAQYQLGSAQRQEAAQNALSDVYKSAFNPETGAVNNAMVLKGLAERGVGHLIPDVQAKLLEAQTKQATLKKTTTETSGLEFKQRVDKANKAISDIAALNSPEEAIASINQHLANGDIDAQKADMMKAQLTQAPSFGAWQKGMLTNILDAKEKLTLTAPKPTATNLGGKIVFLDLNPNSPTFRTEVVDAQKTTMTPGEIASNAIAKDRLALEQSNATKPVFNAQAGGFIAPVSKENPEGKFIPATGIQAAKDQQIAVKALQSAGYDPVTGQDNISKLIAKSTSGGLETSVSAVAAFFGKSTEGRKAISALEGTANQIATDLAGGKLGAGISNSDRDFIVSALGDVANPMKPAGDRLAGWEAAKERMMRAGLIPPPKAATAAAGAVDTSNPLLGGKP
jgi:hypothetical protein